MVRIEANFNRYLTKLNLALGLFWSNLHSNDFAPSKEIREGFWIP